jgi:hypothetical protein
MTDKTDETGKGPHGPGEAPKRPYATIDLQATEIGAKPRSQAAAPDHGKPQPKTAALPPPVPERLAGAWTALAGAVGVTWTWLLKVVRGDAFPSHAAAGVAGAALTLAVGGMLGVFARSSGERVAPDIAKRLATVEKALLQRPALPEEVAARLAAADARLDRVDERVEAAQARAAADTKALEGRIASTDATERIAKIETALAALAPDDKPGGTPLTERLASQLADVEKLTGEASEAKAAGARAERELAALKSESVSLRQSVEALKGSVDARLKDAARAGDLAPVLAKLAAVERDLNAIKETEGDRVTSSRQVLLTLEIANLKRALERGDGYRSELDAVRKAAGGSADLSALDRYSQAGVPTLGALTQEFKRVANAAADAESERPDASVVERLMAGARSIVRLRKAHHDADDTSAEATLGRMESALKDGRVGEVLARGKRLPPKAALAAEDWLRKLEGRSAADRAVADLESALKASLAAQRPPAPEAKR